MKKVEDHLPYRNDHGNNLKQLGFKPSSPITPSALIGEATGREEPADPKVEMISTTVEYSNFPEFNTSPTTGDDPFNM